MAIVDRMVVSAPAAAQVVDLDGLRALQHRAASVFVDRSVQQYAVDLVQATRHPERFGMPDLGPVIALGGSPRATLALVRGAKALAVLRGRTYASPQEVFDVAPEVLRHRMLLTYDAMARDITIEQVLQRLLATVPAVWVSPRPNDAFSRS
jgi:MoxR-like ATPase